MPAVIVVRRNGLPLAGTGFALKLTSLGQLVYSRIPGTAYFAQLIFIRPFVFISRAVWIPAARWSYYQHSCLCYQQRACGIVLSPVSEPRNSRLRFYKSVTLTM